MDAPLNYEEIYNKLRNEEITLDEAVTLITGSECITWKDLITLLAGGDNHA